MSNNLKINIIFKDGTSREAYIPSGLLSLAKPWVRTMPNLFDGTGLDPFVADFENVVAITRADHDALHCVSTFGRKADFRLGQMDMKASILDMLRDAAGNSVDESRTGLIVAANLVESMEVPHADT